MDLVLRTEIISTIPAAPQTLVGARVRYEHRPDGRVYAGTVVACCGQYLHIDREPRIITFLRRVLV